MVEYFLGLLSAATYPIKINITVGKLRKSGYQNDSLNQLSKKTTNPHVRNATSKNI